MERMLSEEPCLIMAGSLVQRARALTKDEFSFYGYLFQSSYVLPAKFKLCIFSDFVSHHRQFQPIIILLIYN